MPVTDIQIIRGVEATQTMGEKTIRGVFANGKYGHIYLLSDYFLQLSKQQDEGLMILLLYAHISHEAIHKAIRKIIGEKVSTLLDVFNFYDNVSAFEDTGLFLPNEVLKRFIDNLQILPNLLK